MNKVDKTRMTIRGEFFLMRPRDGTRLRRRDAAGIFRKAATVHVDHNGV